MISYLCPPLMHHTRLDLIQKCEKQSDIIGGGLSQCFSVIVVFCSTIYLNTFLTENNMAVKYRFPLFLDLPPPALLGMLHFVQDVGSRV